MSVFLGVQVTKDSKTKTINLSQPGLIEQVILKLSLVLIPLPEAFNVTILHS
jgi:hypothetical protein